MRKILLAAALSLSFAAPLLAATPREAWEQGHIADNEAWAAAPFAILKIQDAAYIGEGESATLIGTRGKPASYKWTPGKKPGVLVATVKNGHPVVTKDGKTFSEAEIGKGIAIDKDVAIKGAQTQVNAGVIGARIFVYNQQAKEAKAFRGVDYFPYDPAFVVKASFKPDLKLPPRVFRTSRGTDKQFFHAGEATFVLKGKTVTLPFYTGDGDPAKVADMSAFFTDDLTGKGTYGAGRYVDIAGFGKFPPKTVSIDFNYAYNPNCARSPFYTCPIALDVIPLAMRAGEKDPHQKH